MRGGHGILFGIFLFATFPCLQGATFRVLNINMWGLPTAQYNQERFIALAEILRDGSYDVVLLQEVWFKNEYDIIKDTLPYVSPFNMGSNLLCSIFGAAQIPLECSGLVILSQHPIEQIWFEPYSARGKLIIDGNFAARKGLGVARISWNGITMDVSTSHFTSYTLNEKENLWTRTIQARETIEILQDSTADVKIWGGDLNNPPNTDQPFGCRRTLCDSPYQIMASYLSDTQLEVHGQDSSNEPQFFTYGNSRNSFTADTRLPDRIDYFFYTSESTIQVNPTSFVLPPLMAPVGDGSVTITDHEPLLAEYDITRI